MRADPGARPQHARQLRLARQAEYRLATGDEAVEAPTLAAYDDLARLMSALQDLAHMARRLNARQIARRSRLSERVRSEDWATWRGLGIVSKTFVYETPDRRDSVLRRSMHLVGCKQDPLPTGPLSAQSWSGAPGHDLVLAPSCRMVSGTAAPELVLAVTTRPGIDLGRAPFADAVQIPLDHHTGLWLAGNGPAAVERGATLPPVSTQPSGVRRGADLADVRALHHDG